MIGFDMELNEIYRTDLANVFPFAEGRNGYLPVNITNVKGTQYWGVLKPDGEFLFEPQEGKFSEVYDFTPDDGLLIFLRTGKYGYVYGAAFDDKGNQLLEFEDYEYSYIGYHNGVVKTVKQDSHEPEYIKL